MTACWRLVARPPCSFSIYPNSSVGKCHVDVVVADDHVVVADDHVVVADDHVVVADDHVVVADDDAAAISPMPIYQELHAHDP